MEIKQSKMKYSEKLKDPRWQKKRLEIFNRDDFTCQYCGSTEKTLHVHHKKYNGEPWEAENDDLVTLCESCHKIRTDDKTTCEYLYVMHYPSKYHQSVVHDGENLCIVYDNYGGSKKTIYVGVEDWLMIADKLKKLIK